MLHKRRLKPDPEMVKLLFTEFRKELWELPSSARPEIFMLIEPVTCPLKELILDMSGTSSDIFLICTGQVLQIRTEKLFRNYMEQEAKIEEEEQIRKAISRQQNYIKFTGVTVIGIVILHFVQKNPALKQLIKQRRQAMESKEFQERLELLQGTDKLIPGDVFGDFSETKGRKYSPYYEISTGAPTKILKIPNKALKELFVKSVTPENITLVSKAIRDETSMKILTKKICRCAVEREYPAGTVIVKED